MGHAKLCQGGLHLLLPSGQARQLAFAQRDRRRSLRRGGGPHRSIDGRQLRQHLHLLEPRGHERHTQPIDERKLGGVELDEPALGLGGRQLLCRRRQHEVPWRPEGIDHVGPGVGQADEGGLLSHPRRERRTYDGATAVGLLAQLGGQCIGERAARVTGHDCKQ